MDVVRTRIAMVSTFDIRDAITASQQLFDCLVHAEQGFTENLVRVLFHPAWLGRDERNRFLMTNDNSEVVCIEDLLGSNDTRDWVRFKLGILREIATTTFLGRSHRSVERSCLTWKTK